MRSSACRLAAPAWARRALLVLPLSVVALAVPAMAGAALPDNRGWEIVTPQDQGDDAFSLNWAAPDGNATAFQSLASFAGNTNGGSGSYRTRRGADGWTTEAMTPPGSATGAEPTYAAVGVSRDGDRFIWSGKYDNFDGSRDVFVGTGVRTAVNASAAVRPSADSAMYVGKSPDADHVLFSVRPPYGQPDPPLLYDYTDGAARPVGILPGETTPNPDGSVLGSFEHGYGTGSVFNAVSDDGSRIFFESPAPVPVGGGQIPNPTGLYVRENGTTSKPIDPNAIYWDATPDGKTVLYTPADGSGNLGLSTYDVTNGHATQIAPPGAQVQGIGGTSDDLSRVYFVARGDLAGGATAGATNLYLYDRTSNTPLRFVASLNPSPGGAFAEAQHFSSKDAYASGAITTMASADGRLLEFVSSARLTDVDNHGAHSVYLFDADATTNPLVCISCNPGGAAPIGDSFLSQNPDGYTPASIDNGVLQLLVPPTNITVDNRRVFFETPNALDPQDQNGKTDVYEWADGAAHLISSGTGVSSRFMVATPSGDDAFFITANALTWQAKSSNLRGIYDARVGGGIPQPVVPPRCEEEQTCQGAGSSPPSPPSIGSVAFEGEGSVPLARGPVKTSMSVSKLKAVTGSSAKLKVRVPDAGRVSVAGSSIRSSSVSAAKAGSYSVKVALSAKAKASLKKRKSLKVSVRVSYRATDGQTAAKTVQVTFKQPKAKAKKGGR
ncbi:MAG TPA: hypothetical protein VFY45_02255 [Baekduia sp.]|nr:hypothetical protein [Baekduia sp.]